LWASEEKKKKEVLGRKVLQAQSVEWRGERKEGGGVGRKSRKERENVPSRGGVLGGGSGEKTKEKASLSGNPKKKKKKEKGMGQKKEGGGGKPGPQGPKSPRCALGGWSVFP